ncbi:MAG: hypothetical protein R6W99_05190 [Clostridia bacterium]
MKNKNISNGRYYQANLVRRIEDLYNFFFLMYISRLFLLNPVYGGALFTSGLVWTNYHVIYGRRFGLLEKGGKILSILIAGAAAASTGYLLFIYPFRFRSRGIAFIMAAALIILLRPAVDKFIRTARVRLVLYTAMIVALIPFIVVFADEATHVLIPAGLLVGCIIAYVRNLIDDGTSDDLPEPGAARGVRINSYRLYANTVVVTTASLQIMIMMYVSYMRYVTKPDFLGNILNTYVISLLALVLVMAIVAFLQKKVRLQQYEKTLIFVIAAICWITAVLDIFNSGTDLTRLSSYISIVIIIMGISFVIMILAAMQEDFNGIFSLDRNQLEKRTMGGQMKLLDRQAGLVAYFTVLMMLTSLCLNPAHQSGEIDNPGVFTGLVKFYMLVVPAIFLFLGVLYSIRQPLSRKYSAKLKNFVEGLVSNKKNPELEKQLVDVLVRKHSNSFGIKIIAFILYPLLKHSVEGVENVRGKDPAVFVCNHKEIYGPVVTNLYMPFICRPWIINGMVERDKIYDHLINGYNMKNSRLPASLKKAYCRFLTPIMHWAMNSVEPIPVFKDEGKDIIKTISLTVEALEQEDNILLFPEDNSRTDGYTDKPGEFFTGFAHIGKAYYKKTGKAVSFYPVYADSERKTLFIGRGIEYDKRNTPLDEKSRIVSHLKESMDRMAMGFHEAGTAD